MKANSLTVASAALWVTATTLGIVLAAGAAGAQERRPASPPVPQSTTPGVGSTVGRPGPTSAQGNYQADYHADYSVKGPQTGTGPTEPARGAPHDTRRQLEPRAVPGLEPYARTPFGWPR